MKKFLPLLLFALLAFAGCDRGPAVYEPTDNPREIVTNAEKFVKKVEKKSRHYNAEDWDAAIFQFVQMGKNFYENKHFLTDEEIMQFDNARVKFISAVDANGDEELARRVKTEYSKITE